MGFGLSWVFNHTIVHTSDSSDEKQAFKMPLNYPRYTKADYETMEEYKLDMLLRQYGLDHHIKGTIEEKREFAMGTFLWPNQV
ncbi:hypothetical protein RND81_09G061500 [Saponaria officinalis]|uniref:DUF7722 domain-containing protein n=1 Tax=Saponaria officinalis TaxID=3572 RepID=A0AAW1IJB9_SAPOF